MLSTADLISGLVAFRSTRKVNSCWVSCDSSFATSAFSVITGDLMMFQTVLTVRPPPSSVYAPVLAWPVQLRLLLARGQVRGIRSLLSWIPTVVPTLPPQCAKVRGGRDKEGRRCLSRN